VNKIKGLILAAFLAGPIWAPAVKAEDVAFRLGENDFIVPLRQVEAVQLYSFGEGKGYPAVESVLARRSTWKVSVGAAAELGTGVNVPFLSAATRLTPRFFDTGNNDLYFGVWVGRPSKGDRVLWGVSASTALW
jgi:hypothetical protein